MEQTGMTPAQRAYMLAVRREMGWPLTKPTVDSIDFTTSEVLQTEGLLDLARVARMLGKDLVHTQWKSPSAVAPESFAIAYREQARVDVVERVIPYAATGDAPLIFVNAHRDEHFAIDGRGSLMRRAGKPGDIGNGQTRAAARIRATAAMLGEMLAADDLKLAGAVSFGVRADDVIVRLG